jgi:hypothetical protein
MSNKTPRIGAPDGARVPQGTTPYWTAPFGAPPPRGEPRELLFDINRALERVAGMNGHAKISVSDAAKLLLSRAIIV